jgi:hypothetical protein
VSNEILNFGLIRCGIIGTVATRGLRGRTRRLHSYGEEDHESHHEPHCGDGEPAIEPRASFAADLLFVLLTLGLVNFRMLVAFLDLGH